jgi:hypothetical protein
MYSCDWYLSVSCQYCTSNNKINACHITIRGYILFVLQRKWLNDYHKRCYDEVGVAILLEERGNKKAFDWLKRRTQPIPYDYTFSGSPPLTQHCFGVSTLIALNVYLGHILITNV